MAEQTETDAPTRKLPLKTILVVGIVFIIEAVAISAAFLFAGGPEPTAADPGAEQSKIEFAEQPIEILVVDGKFPNTGTGRTYLYDVEIFIVLKRKHQIKAEGEIEARQAQIADDVREIISRAEPAQLAEPRLAAIKRMIKQKLELRLPRDEDGQTIVIDVAIKKWTHYRADI